VCVSDYADDFIGRPDPTKCKVKGVETRPMQLFIERSARITGDDGSEIAVRRFAGSRANANVRRNTGDNH
jgi:hypothetical protein